MLQPEQASGALQFLLPTIEREHATTVKVLSAVPAERLDYRPDPKSMSAMDLVWHIAASELYFLTGVADGKFGEGGKRPEAIKTPADVVGWYKEQFAANLARVKQLKGEDLTRMVTFHGTWNFPAIAFVQMMMNHSVHHRGQLSTYLRPMGAKVPAIYGMSADDDGTAKSEAGA